MPRRTFTVLVTVECADGAGHSHSRISEAIQIALEEGTSNTAPFMSAQVDAFKGLPGGIRGTDLERYQHVLMLHR